ncbi:hypothetical protein F4604DRAFT_1959827 [Suillus subluteus]|nr:hypothetical protein F4604DRAFT_1959827 [Suillus subluteus]
MESSSTMPYSGIVMARVVAVCLVAGCIGIVTLRTVGSCRGRGVAVVFIFNIQDKARTLPHNTPCWERIISHNLKDWMRRRNIAWECFCGLLTEHCTPARFDTNRHGHAMAYCHQSPSECGFSLNISEARETALYESVYTDVLTRVYLNHPRLVDLRDLVLRVHRDRLTAIPSEHAQLFPFFEGYCGTPISALAPSQRGGAVRNIASYRRRPISALNMRC